VIDRPDAHRLLLAVAEALTDEVVPVLSASASASAPVQVADPEAAAARYTARIAANLCRIVAREAELWPQAEAATVADLRGLLGRDGGSLEELSRALDDELRTGAGDLDPGSVHRVLSAAAGRRLAIARPSYGDDLGGGHRS